MLEVAVRTMNFDDIESRLDGKLATGCILFLLASDFFDGSFRGSFDRSRTLFPVLPFEIHHPCRWVPFPRSFRKAIRQWAQGLFGSDRKNGLGGQNRYSFVLKFLPQSSVPVPSTGRVPGGDPGGSSAYSYRKQTSMPS